MQNTNWGSFFPSFTFKGFFPKPSYVKNYSTQLCTNHSLFWSSTTTKMTVQQFKFKFKFKFNSLSLSSLSHQSKSERNLPSSFHSYLPLQHLSYLNHRTTTQPFSLSPKFAHCNQTLPPSNPKSPPFVKSQLYCGFTAEAIFVQSFKHIER